MKDHTQDIDWMKTSLARIEAQLTGGLTRLGQSLISIENQNAEVCGKLKWHKIAILGAWGVLGTVITTAVTGVVIYLIKYHHIHS